MKAANMRAQLVAQIAGQIAAATAKENGIAIHQSIDDAQDLVDEVERRLGEPIYHDRPTSGRTIDGGYSAGLEEGVRIAARSDELGSREAE